MRPKPAQAQKPAGKFPVKKHLGQNFLVDPNITRKIIAACELKLTDTVLEIGPGQGVLTAEIAQRVRQVIAVETDRDLCHHLTQKFEDQNVTIVHADFLKYDLSGLPTQVKVIGNLPYYISSAIIDKILKAREQFVGLWITVQTEFARRLNAKPDTKDYSSLSCFVQYYAAPQILFEIKRTCFHPIPKVDSSFVKLLFQDRFPLKAEDEHALFVIIRHAFQQRRKNILNALSNLFDKKNLMAVLETLKLSPTARAENLRLSDYVLLSNAMAKGLRVDRTQRVR